MKSTIILVLVVVSLIMLLNGCIYTSRNSDNQLENKELNKGITFIESKEWGVEQASLGGDYIAYFDKSTDELGDIFVYNINTGEKRRITYDNSKQSYPKVRDNKIYWVDERTIPSSIWVYDLETGKEQKTELSVEEFLLNNFGFCAPPGLISTSLPPCPLNYGHSACYQSICVRILRGDKVFTLYDLSTNTTSKLEETFLGYDRENLYLWENKLIWADNRNGVHNFDIFMYNLEDGTETQITNTQDAIERTPTIHGNLIAFSRCYPPKSSLTEVQSNCQIILLNLDTGGEKILWELFGNNIQINENKVVWDGWKKSSFSSKDKIIFLYVVE